MPRGDGTGPSGKGAMTGRGAGFCNNSVRSRCFSGFGRGRGNRRKQNSFSGDEKELLSNQKDVLENQIKQINKRLSDLDKD
jgi:hypothetical protein